MEIIKCNCGKDGRYTVNGNMDVLSCNKRALCPTYDEISKSLDELKKMYANLASASEDLTLFREGTTHYKDAEMLVKHANKVIKESGINKFISDTSKGRYK